MVTLALAYVEFLYTPAAQKIAAENHYRPTDPAVAAQFAGRFAKVKPFTVGEVFGGWRAAQARHFSDGGEFDKLAAIN